jgi:hypothetical protein
MVRGFWAAVEKQRHLAAFCDDELIWWAFLVK